MPALGQGRPRRLAPGAAASLIAFDRDSGTAQPTSKCPLVLSGLRSNSASMIRKIVLAAVIVAVADIASVLGGYGIRIKERPCTHLTGIGIIVNYVASDCRSFRWELAGTP